MTDGRVDLARQKGGSACLLISLRFSQQLSREPLVLEYRQDKGCACDRAYLTGTRGDVLECLPSLGKQRKSSFTQAPRRAEQHIPGARVNVQLFNAFRLLRRREDAVTCAVVPAVR